MLTTPRRAFGRFVDGLPEARYEALLALLRGLLLIAGAISLLLEPTAHELWPPFAVNVLLGVASFALAAFVTQVAHAERARTIGRLCTVMDVALYAGYCLAFSGRPGAGAMIGVFVLLEGPLRFGVRGVLATVVPVGLIALVWPQLDSAGQTTSTTQVVVLCALFAVPTVLLRSLILRGSARVRQAELQFTTAFEHASIGMALADLDLKVVQANRSLCQLYGAAPALVLGTGLECGVDLLDRDRYVAALRGLTTESPSTQIEVRLRRPDGGLRWGHVAATLLGGNGGHPSRIVVQVENITERKRSEAMLSHAAAHDALTDLPNRSMLLTRLEAALVRDEQVGILFLDLDRFKVVNDGLGHAAGDLLLVEVAIRLREVMRPDDMVARLGGDEFVVLCRYADEEICSAVAARILDALNQPVATIGGGELVVGASIGIAMTAAGMAPSETAELVLRDADTAMYAAKQAGGGRSHVFSTALREAAVRTHELEVDLRAAVRNGDLYVVYQPVISLTHGRLLGCEALVRWEHPRRGLVPTADFIAVAEQSDLILELGEVVLQQAVADLASWRAGSGSDLAPTVSVNVSPRQLMNADFVDRVCRLLDRSGVEPNRLCLEVTETALVNDVDHIVAVLSDLRSRGVRLSIDDFGTGHASLTYLARFPVDQVKIDQSFVAGLGIDARSAAIVGGVLGMAHTFDLSVVAEGVESPRQLEALREMGCDAVQGYLLGLPVRAWEIANLLSRPTTGSAVRHRVPDPRAARIDLDALAEGALGGVLEQALATLAASVPFTRGSVVLVEDEQTRLVASRPAAAPHALSTSGAEEQGMSRSVLATGQARYAPQLSSFAVPLVVADRTIGVLQVQGDGAHAFTENQRSAVLSFSQVLALAVSAHRTAVGPR